MEENSNWFKLKVKYLVQTEDSIKKKTSEYVLKAYSFTDAEASLLEHLKDEFEYNLVSCSKFNLEDVLKDDTKESYFKVKLVYTSANPDTGKETKIIENYLVQANSTNEADKIVTDRMQGSIVDFEIENVQKTKVIEAFYTVNK
tara:strand:+ start:771 stop:1202 length:432 start_codon:yes stop_codon:yes gene_type:complete